jgi:hypothetical protein
MRSVDLKQAFEASLSKHGLSVSHLGALDALNAATDFYLDQRFEDVEVTSDGDALLFQWGTYDWGKGPSFQYDVTRQTIAGSSAEDDDIWQLSLTLHYAPSAQTADLGSGDAWCWTPADITTFRDYVESQPCTHFARTNAPLRVELRHGSVG